VVLTLVLVWAGLGAAGGAEEPLVLVAVGAVTHTRAVVWARTAGPGAVHVEVGPAAGGERRRFGGQPDPAADLTVKVPVDGLAPATRHAYRVRWRDTAVEGQFLTAPAPGMSAPATVVWSGDLGGPGHCRRPAGEYAIFRAMAARRPDLFLFAGDTVYADYRCRVPESAPGANFEARDVAGFRAKQRYQRVDPAAEAFYRSTAVEAIWDDHEVANDFSGPAEPLMPAGRQAFLEYWPIVPPAEEPGRLYRRFRWGRLLEVFVLDTRQYRSPNVEPDGPGKTMLGPAQRRWLVAGLQDSTALWKLVVTSVTLSVPTGRPDRRDGWASGGARPDGPPTGFEHELLAIVRALAAARVRNLVWLSADVHRAEVLRHAPMAGAVFHELTVGPLGAGFGRPGVLDGTLRPTRLFAEGGYYSFGELRAEETGLTVRIIDDGGRARFETVLRPEP
jgi:alkaline phosphatase D